MRALHKRDPLPFLVSEDDNKQREVIKLILRKHGYHIVSASTGREALQKLEEEHAQLLAWIREGEKLTRQPQELERLAMRDPLTGLFNRCHFEEKLDQEFERSRRYHRPFAILMADIDNFKKVNDTYGHDVGDNVLKKIGRVLREKTRKSDTQVRYGGEEFVLILPEVGLERAIQVGNKICREIRKLVFSTPASVFSVTVSIGIASSSAKRYSHWKGILKDADLALYTAKASGKDRVRTANSPVE